MFRLIFLAVTQAILMCTCQSLFKVAADRMGTFSWTWHFFRDGILFNWVLALSGFAGICSFVEWIYMVRHYPFSQVYPLSSLSYLFGIIVAIIFFHETVSWSQWIGVFLMLAGCYLIAR